MGGGRGPWGSERVQLLCIVDVLREKGGYPSYRIQII